MNKRRNCRQTIVQLCIKVEETKKVWNYHVECFAAVLFGLSIGALYNYLRGNQPIVTLSMILLYTLRTHCLLPMKKRRLVKKIARQLRALNQNERTGLRRDLEAESDRLQSEQDNQEPRQRRRTSQELMGIYAAMAYLHETVELPNGTISRLTGGEPSETAARGLSEVRVRDGG